MSTDNPPKRPSRILVTGGAGFIGSNLVHWLLKQWPDCSIVNLDALTYAGNPANFADLENESRHSFVKGDICDRVLVAKLCDEGIDAIVNVAAHTHVDRSLLGGDDFVGTNVGGVQALCEVIKERNHIRLLHVSTDEVYGSQSPDESANESFPIVPRNPYSAAKAGGDLLALAYKHSFDLDIVITRCCNNYGPYHYPEKMIPLFVTNLFDDKQVPLYGDGLNSRQWIHVEDHCAAIARVLEAGRRGEVYNISTGVGLTNLELTDRLLEITGRDKTLIRYVQDRPGHDRRYALDDTKIRSELGWSPKFDFETGLAQTVQWFRDNEQWWRPIKSGEYRKYYEEQYGERIQH